MAESSRFLGIVIAVYYRDHAPPHFHAVYGEFHAAIAIRDGTVTGHLPKRVLANVEEWRILHQEELAAAWRLAQAGLPLLTIESLE